MTNENRALPYAGGPRSRQRARWLRRAEPYLYLAPVLGLLLLVVVVPLGVAILYSFRDLVLYRPWETGFNGLANYRQLGEDQIFLRALLNTARWTVYSVVWQFFLGLILALLLNKPFRGRSLYQSLVFVPWAVPPFLTGLIFAWLFNPVIGPLPHAFTAVGAMDSPFNVLSHRPTALGAVIVANIWFGIPFFAITLLAGLRAIPNEMYEAASIDGANALGQFRFITLPFLAPTIAITVLLRTVWIANFATLIWVMTGGGPGNASQTVATYVFTLAYSRLDFGYAAAVAMFLVLLLIVYAAAVLVIRRKWEI